MVHLGKGIETAMCVARTSDIWFRRRRAFEFISILTLALLSMERII